MIRYFALALALVATTSAQAQQKMRFTTSLPPVEYDKPYVGELTIRRFSTEQELRYACPKVDFKYHALACAGRMPNDTSRCNIYMVTDKILKAAGFGLAVVLRHELGHCNGWVGHAGGRRVSANADVAMPALPALMQELAAYPPIVCVTPDWKPESCTNRKAEKAESIPVVSIKDRLREAWRFKPEGEYTHKFIVIMREQGKPALHEQLMTHDDCSASLSKAHRVMVDQVETIIKFSDGLAAGLVFGAYCVDSKGTWMGYGP
jgi:hypothetical protein